jgi:hypothetical protein
MKTFYDLMEAVTRTKLVKMHAILKQKIAENAETQYELLELDINNPNETKSFMKKVFGEAKGLYINTEEEQTKLLRRFYDDYHKESGSIVRPVYTELSMNPAI